MLNIIFFPALLVLTLVFSKNAIHMFQQNRYEFYRYTKWLLNWQNWHFSPILILAIIFIILAFADFAYRDIIVIILAYLGGFYYLYKEKNHEYIKPLVYTARIKRTIIVFGLFEALLFCLAFIFHIPYGLIAVDAIYGPYLLIYIVALVMLPLEKAVKQHYENLAIKKLRSLDKLKIIGITGSFGKTSVKNIIHDILDESFYTLMTPASYNTPMGITRTIREYLKPIHEVFVCEMGADHVGEISHLMCFVRPQYGIVTSIGPQHLNTFHNMDNIIHEKMQAIELLPEDGVGIINIDNKYIADYHIQNKCRVVTVGIHNEKADYRAENIVFHRRGSSFTVAKDGVSYPFETGLLGEHNIMNILMGIALADIMGIAMEDIVKAVAQIKQIEHRLEIKEINGYTFIDNAFNSNPVSSKNSLDVLKMMDGMRVIVTPGLIDLGHEEARYNKEFGAYMPGRADLVLLVGPLHTKPIYEGLIEAGFNQDKILVFDTVKEAFNYIYMHLNKDATILLENDLPDAFSH